MGEYGAVSFGLRVALLVFNIVALIVTAISPDIFCIIFTPISLVLVATDLGIEMKNPNTPQAKKIIFICIDTFVFLLLLAGAILMSISYASIVSTMIIWSMPPEDGPYSAEDYSPPYETWSLQSDPSDYGMLTAKLAFMWICSVVGFAVIVWDILLLANILKDDGKPGLPWYSKDKFDDEKDTVNPE